MKYVDVPYEDCARTGYLFQVGDHEVLSAPSDIVEKLKSKQPLVVLEALAYFAGKDVTRGEQ